MCKLVKCSSTFAVVASPFFLSVANATPIQVEFLNAKRIHREIVAYAVECDFAIAFAIGQLQLVKRDRHGRCSSSSQRTSAWLPHLLPPVRLPAPVYHLPSTVYGLRSPTPWGDSFYATLFVCLLRASLFHLDFCSVTGTRWYSEYASKFVSFSPTGGTRRYEIG